mmetsp:Transcript_20279/g.58625  ORF Transcript_20279/g.58625 Transcript_20279/m.58625 type:complete len:388 (-) Transcript_20279:1461-2624(-)
MSLGLLFGAPFPKQPPCHQVEGLALQLGNEKVGRPLDLVMGKLVRRPGLAQDALGDGDVQRYSCALRPLGIPVDYEKELLPELRPERGGDTQRAADLPSQLEELSRQQLHDAVGDDPVPDTVNVPLPAPAREGVVEQSLVLEGDEELHDEEGVPPRLPQDLLGQGTGHARRQAGGVGEEGVDVVDAELPHLEGRHGDVRQASDVGDAARQGMVRPDLVDAVATNQQQAVDGAVGHDGTDEEEARLVGELEVVQEQHHRTGTAAGRPEQGPEREEETLERLPTVHLGGDGPILDGTGDPDQVGDEAREDGGPLGPHGFADGRSDRPDSTFVGGKDPAVLVHGRDDGRQWPDLTHRVELARDEGRAPVTRDESIPQVIDEGRLARARVA